MPEWIEIIVRSFTFLIVLFFLTRWLGKKHMSKSNIFQFISGIVLGAIAAIHASTLSSPIHHGLIAMGIWFLVPFLVELLAVRSKVVRDFFQGKGTVMIQEGKIMEDNLKKERYTTDDLLENLREKKVFQVADVEFAVLEPTGILNVLPKKETQPLSAKDLGVKVSPMKQPETVIMDGKMLLEPLSNLSLNPNWLETELEKLNVTIENVFLGQADQDGQLTVDLYDDKINVPAPTEKPLLLATLKKCQADLELFALATENTDSKAMYEKNSVKLQDAIDLITPYMK